MPRSDRKKPTLRERALDHANRQHGLRGIDAAIFADGAVWSSRANRLTKAERAELRDDILRTFVAWLSADDKRNAAMADEIMGYIERAKGRK